jgi:hypothetical protein
MTGSHPRGGRSRVAEGLEILGLRVVLLAYWGTVSALSVLTPGNVPSPDRGESVRPKG